MTGVLRGHAGNVTTFASSTNGLLYSGDSAGTIRTWQNGKCLAVLEGPSKGHVWAMACAPNGDLYSSHFVYNRLAKYTVWVWRQNQCVGKLEDLKIEEPTGHGAFSDLGNTRQIVFAKDGTMYTLSDVGSGQIGHIVVWRDNRPLKVLHEEPPKLAAQSGYRTQVAIGVNDDLYVGSCVDEGRRFDVAFWRNEQYHRIRNIDCGDSPGDLVEYDNLVTVGSNGVVYVLHWTSKLHREHVSFQVLMWKDDAFLGHLDVSNPLAAGEPDLEELQATR
jgi:WD40 repeat protein